MASRGHEILVRTENYLRSIGKNNGAGKYDKVTRGVKSLLEQGFLEGAELEKAIKREADRLLKKYALDARTADKVYDPVLCMMVDADTVRTRDAIVGYFVNPMGKQFKKEFSDRKEFADFIESARKAGTKFIASHGTEYKKFF